MLTLQKIPNISFIYYNKISTIGFGTMGSKGTTRIFSGEDRFLGKSTL